MNKLKIIIEEKLSEIKKTKTTTNIDIKEKIQERLFNEQELKKFLNSHGLVLEGILKDQDADINKRFIIGISVNT
jgi:hypothetical protein